MKDFSMDSAERHRKHNLQYYHERRQEFIQKLGGRCVMCGSTDNLELDHIDSTRKSFNIAARMSYAHAAVAEEVDKCQLLCRSCHIKKTKEMFDAPYKLDGETVRKICAEYMTGGVTQDELGAKYGVSGRTVSSIINGDRWRTETAGIAGVGEFREAGETHRRATRALRLPTPIERLDLRSGEVIETYGSMAEAASFGYKPGAISRCCSGKLKSHKGYGWRKQVA